MDVEMDIVKKDIYVVEKMVQRAWPANITIRYEKWLLRATDGVTKRANSVFTVGPIPKHDKWLADIEQFYFKHQITPCFYISALSPEPLDKYLANKWYDKTGAMYVMYQHSQSIARIGSGLALYGKSIEQRASLNWINNFLRLEQFSEHTRRSYESIFSNITLPKAFLTIYDKEKAVGLGTVVIDNSWGYVSNVVVDRTYRRRGIGTLIMQQLATFAMEHGADKLFLQVLTDNNRALYLYRRLGFKKLSTGHYRIKV